MGGSSKSQTTGYKYITSLMFNLCKSPVDSLLKITIEDKDVLDAPVQNDQVYIDKPDLFGGDTDQGGVSGTLHVMNGAPDQLQNSYLVGLLGEYVPAFRGVLNVLAERFYIGTLPQLKKWAFLVSRIHVRGYGELQWYDEKAAIPSGVTTSTFENYDFDAKGDGVNAAHRYQGVAIYANPTDVLKVTKHAVADGGLYAAWRIGVFYPWQSTVYVKKGDSSGPIETFWNATYSTEAEAEEGAVIAGAFELTGYSEYSFNVYDDLYSDNQGGLSLSIEIKNSILDMNPAHIIRECLTDPYFGLGWDESDIDNDSFTYAADILFSEQMGISILWTQENSVFDFINLIGKHINATVYIERTTGKFILKLIRDDYNFEDLLVLDTSNVSSIDDFSQAKFGEFVTSVTVTYYDSITGKTASLTVSDSALTLMQGFEINTPVTYEGFTNSSIASRVGLRDLKVLSSGLISCSLIANRDAKNLNMGDCFVLNWPDYGISNLVMRVTSIAFGNGISNAIKINCTQDVYATPDTAVIAPTPPDGIPVVVPPQPVANSIVFEIPYLEAVQQFGQSPVDNNVDANPEICYAGVAAARPSSNSKNARIFSDSGAGYVEVGGLDFCPYAELDGDLFDLMETEITIKNALDINEAPNGTWFQLGEEILEKVSYVEPVLTVKRGLLDTLPIKHFDGESLYFWDNYAEGDGTEYAEGETINIKLCPVTSSGKLPLDQAIEESILLKGRLAKPYPPGNLKINGDYFPINTNLTDDLSLTWSHRDRKQQTSSVYVSFNDSDIGPEAESFYNVRIYDQFDTLLHTESPITNNNYTYSLAQETIDKGGSGSGTRIEPYWPQVTLLMNFNGPNGSTDFFDSSDNFLTVGGDAKLSTAEFKYGKSSVYFDGNGDYLEEVNPDLDIASADFTVECWVYVTATPAVTQTIMQFVDGTFNGLHIHRNPSGYLFVDNGNSATTAGTIVIPLNVWTHIAVVRNVGNIEAYVDGLLALTHTAQSYATAVKLQIGRYGVETGVGTVTRLYNGYIDDLRVTKGDVRYTTTFTPPARQFEKYQKDASWSDNAVALIFEGENNSTLIDDYSDNNLQVSVFGGATLSTAQFKYGVSSLYLDGAYNSFISTPFNSVFTGLSDLTIEAFIYTTDVTRSGTIACNTLLATAGIQAGWLLGMSNTGRLFAEAHTDPGALAFNIYPATTLLNNTWYHIALVRNGTTWTLYLDGVSIGTATESAAIGVSGDGLYIGRDQWTLITWLGYIDEFRIRTGAQYTANFTPPASTFLPADPYWANVVLLSNFEGDNNSTLIENIAPISKTATVYGNAQISTTQYKYGGASGLFDGSGDYISFADSEKFYLNSDFTIECWLYSVFSSGDYVPIASQNASLASNNNRSMFFYSSSAETIPNAWTFYDYTTGSNILLAVADTPPDNTWFHLAITKEGSNYKFFRNGVQIGTTQVSANAVQNVAGDFNIGVARLANVLQYYNGCIDDFRITNGVARYTANFTPPAKELSKYIDTVSGSLRFELETERDGLISYTKYNVVVNRS